LTLSYKLNYGTFTITPAGCPIIYSFAITDKNGLPVSSPLFASLTDLIPDTSIDVIVGPSNDASLTSNSPYILTVSAKPEQNTADVMTDTI
jgi:hypothetical protein